MSDGFALFGFAVLLLIVASTIVAAFLVVLTIFAAGYALGREPTRTRVGRELFIDAFAGSHGRGLPPARTAGCGCVLYPDGAGYHIRLCVSHGQLIGRGF